jgi:N-acetylglucosamine kinase-like BadF-type ATPase
LNFLGIDAGGSKAIFSLCDEFGRVLATLRGPGFTPADMAGETLHALLSGGIRALLGSAGLPQDGSTFRAACAGMPCYGESAALDHMMADALARCLTGVPHRLVNDAEVAWAGSFALRPGINIVCGTGTIAFGVNASGQTARCGGWSHHFSDEGSGYWLGRKLLELFCKQADGRVTPRGAVYALVRERLGLTDNFDIIPIAERDYLPYRDKVAALQLLLLEAARQGDASAIACYREAAGEIALNAKGIMTRLRFDGDTPVSVSGGIMRVGGLVLDPLRAQLESMGCRLTKPCAAPWAGALMLALQLAGQASPAAIDALSHAPEPE